MGEKTNYMHISGDKQTKSLKKTWTWLIRGNLKRETEYLLIAAQNYTIKNQLRCSKNRLDAINKAIRTNDIKAIIDKMQQNSKCGLCGDRDHTINHIISECSKLAQKGYKTRHKGWEGDPLRIVQEI